MHSKDEQQQKMFSMIDQWQQSGFTQKQFCEQHNIRYYVFHYWLGRYRKQFRCLDPSLRWDAGNLRE